LRLAIEKLLGGLMASTIGYACEYEEFPWYGAAIITNKKLAQNDTR